MGCKRGQVRLQHQPVHTGAKMGTDWARLGCSTNQHKLELEVGWIKTKLKHLLVDANVR